MSITARSKLLTPFLIVIAVLILFWPALIHPFYILHPTFSPFSDTMVIHWPKAHLMAQSWQAGEGLPYWTPLILSGMPLAANQLAMLFYPPAWLFLVLPIEPTFNLLFIFHLLLGGFGIYLLLREKFGLSTAAALLGSLSFALNGKLLAHVAGGHVSMVGAIGWLPWGLFGLHMLLEGKRSSTLQSTQIRWGMLVAVVLTMQIVTHTLLLIYTVYLMGAVITWHFFAVLRDGGWSQIRLETKHLLLPLLLIPILAGLLGAGQLLSLLELVEFSNRSLSLAEATQYSVTPTQLFIGLFLPSAQGGHEFVIYLGLIPLLLVPFGITRTNRWTWFYGGLLVFTLLFALGPNTPVHGLFYEFAPGFRWVRTPARIFFVGALATALLVGFAVERLASTKWSFTAQKRLTRTAIGVGALAAMFGLGLAFGFNQASRATLALAIVVPVGLSLILLRIKSILSAQMATILLGIVLFLDLASFNMSMMRFVPLAEALAPGQAVAEYLAQQTGRFRIYSPSYSLPVQTAAAHSLLLADGVEPVHLASYDQYMAYAGGYHDSSFSVTVPNFDNKPLETALKGTKPNLKLLGLLNVKYLVSAFPMGWPGLKLETKIEGTYIYANEEALPRAWVVHQTLPADVDWLEQLNTLLDVENIATIESGPQLTDSTPRQTSVAIITHYSADLIEIETDISGPGWLIMSEVWYPGWQATVNGSLQPVERVNGLLRGIYLDQPGLKQITMEYQPAAVVWGNRIAGITAGLMILAALWLWIYKI